MQGKGLRHHARIASMNKTTAETTLRNFILALLNDEGAYRWIGEDGELLLDGWFRSEVVKAAVKALIDSGEIEPDKS